MWWFAIGHTSHC
uniref:Uncharacterized protein n=1 Tax=Arundo donax TaxID=35708 RepID=A0A0A9A048_ARUDO